MPISAGK